MYYLGIDLGGTSIKVGIVDAEGKILSEDNVATIRGRCYKEIVKDMATLSLAVSNKVGIQIDNIKSIGIGSPGTPNNDNGSIVYSNNLNFRNANIREELNKYINLPVYIENDANCAALAECMAGAAKGFKNSITITIGTGIGSGVIINNKIYSASNFAAAELGHMVIVVDGEECTCGRRGCWEVYSSATALIKQTKNAAINNSDSVINNIIEGSLNKIDAKTAFDAMRMDDLTGKLVVDNYIKYLSQGIINVINIFQPDVLVLGGGVSNEKEYLLEPLEKIIPNYVYSRHSDDLKQTEIRVAQMRNKAGIIGAAMLGKMG